jgi:DNA-binding transcriptional MerR regulator
VARMTIGEFARRARLSPKALRIYADLGLVVPAEVDPASGYRLYDESQLERARSVALLRRLEMPLATIARVLELDGAAAVAVLSAWWEGVEAGVAERRALVAYLRNRLDGKEAPARDVGIHAMPERKVASISRHVTAGETDAFFHDAFRRLRAVAPSLEGIAGCPFLVFYGEVSEDSDGPVELCRPVGTATPAAAAAGDADIQLRVEPAHEEAYLRLSREETAWPAMLPFWDALEAWVRDHGRKAMAPVRQVLIADRRGAGDETLVCDLSVPLR